QEPSVRILYQPLPASQQIALQGLVEGVFGPAAAGLAALVLWTGTLVTTFTAVGATVILLVTVAAAIVVSLSLATHYGRALHRSLARRSLNANALSLGDAASRRILRRRLRGH